jgi:hypothetical protein
LNQATPVLLQRELAKKFRIRALPQVFVSGQTFWKYCVVTNLSDDDKLAKALLRRTSPMLIRI